MKNKRPELELIPVENASSFMGIKIENEKINIYHPKTLRLTKNNRALTLKFLKSIHLATEMTENIYQTFDGKDCSFPIDAYLWIIDDYLDNGYYFNREKQYSKKSGKTDWKRTLNNPALYSNGNIIYTDIISSKISPTNDLIAEIYKLCLKISFDRIGCLLDLYFFIDIEQHSSVAEMIYITKKCLNETFDEIKKIRFKHMISILSSVNDDTIFSKFFTYGIENYYYVFERMINEYFSGIDDKKEFNPQGHWKFNDDSNPIDSSNLRPDTVLKMGNTIYILDAKMYKYGHTGIVRDLPETQSMQKQITYGDYISTKFGKENLIRNAFILPYNKDLQLFKNNKKLVEIIDENLVYLGYAYVDWRDTIHPKPHDNIFTFLIDMTFLLENYTKTNIYINTLCNAIENLVLSR